MTGQPGRKRSRPGDAVAVGASDPPAIAASSTMITDFTLTGTAEQARSIGTGPHTIASVPFTLRNLKEDLEDVGSNFDGPPELEFRLATKALELEGSGLSYQRVPPGSRFPYGHTHFK